MTAEPSPRPWRVDDSSTHETMGRKFVLIRDANGQKITVDNGRMFDEDAVLIVDAVNQYEWANKEIHRLTVEKDDMFDEAVEIRDERDRLRDIVKRLIEYADAVAGYRHRTIEVLSSKHPARTFDGASIIREARKAIRKKRNDNNRQTIPVLQRERGEVHRKGG